MTRDKLTKISQSIANQVMDMHEGRRSWSAQCGQWLVYGFEQILGFSGGVLLESEVERAFKAKEPIYDAVFKCLLRIYTEADKMEPDN